MVSVVTETTPNTVTFTPTFIKITHTLIRLTVNCRLTTATAVEWLIARYFFFERYGWRGGSHASLTRSTGAGGRREHHSYVIVYMTHKQKT